MFLIELLWTKGEGTCKDPKAGSVKSGRLDKQALAFAIAMRVF